MNLPTDPGAVGPDPEDLEREEAEVEICPTCEREYVYAPFGCCPWCGAAIPFDD